MNDVLEVIKSLELEKRLSPIQNPEITWLYLFMSAFVGYFSLISNHLGSHPVIGKIERYNDNKMTKIFSANAKIQMIYNNTDGYSQGPIWIDDEDNGGGFLMFSDLIENRINRWDEGKGLFKIGKTIYSDNVGCHSNPAYCNTLNLAGPNGMIRVPNSLYPLNPKSSGAINILICMHGERSIGMLHDNGTQTVIANSFRGKKFNSPSDIVMSPEGHVYFTDPPFGLVNKERKVQNRELPFYGVYFIQNIHLGEAMRTGVPTNETKLVHKDMSRPNGLAFSPDYSKLYVGNADPSDAHWKTFHVKDNGNLKLDVVLRNITEELTEVAAEGLPDGVKVDIFGHVFATGAGGVLVMTEEGELIGKLAMTGHVTNIAFGGDGYLYLTIQGGSVARVRINTKPVRIVSTKIKK